MISCLIDYKSQMNRSQSCSMETAGSLFTASHQAGACTSVLAKSVLAVPGVVSHFQRVLSPSLSAESQLPHQANEDAAIGLISLD